MNGVLIRFRFGLILIAVLLTASQLASASDHIDGPVSLANQVADITDLFAYPTPGKPGSLTLILDVYPFVSSTGHFSDRVNYNLILRKASISQDQFRIETDASSEVVITCKFITPQQVAGTQMICASNEAEPRIIGQIAFNELEQPSVGNNIMLFGGRRADPFFLSKDFAASFMKFEKGTPDGRNILDNLNVLSIVMNIEIDQLFPPQELASKKRGREASRKVAQAENYLIAVAAETLTFDSPGAPIRRIDRLGRPEISNISMNTKSAAPEIRDTYNADRPFAPASETDIFSARLKSNIEHYDMIDGVQDWSDTDATRLTGILLDDFLVVDPFMPCTESSYFEIERAVLLGEAHRTCGGRDPNDNVVNKLYTLYEKGALAMPSISVNDGLKGPSKPISKDFPYLAAPYDGIAAWAAEQLANITKYFL